MELFSAAIHDALWVQKSQMKLVEVKNLSRNECMEVCISGGLLVNDLSQWRLAKVHVDVNVQYCLEEESAILTNELLYFSCRGETRSAGLLTT